MIECLKGNIPFIEGELLVNAANGKGWMGGIIGRFIRLKGVAESIHYADHSIERVARQIAKMNKPLSGDVFYTTAGTLNYNHGILHAVTMDKPGQSSSIQIVSKCLDNVLDYCDKNNIKDVVIPLLGCGVGGLNKKTVLDLYKKKLKHSRTNFKVILY